MALRLPTVFCLALFLSRVPGVAADGNVLYEQHLAPYPIQIMVPAEIDGQIYSFILDSGAYMNVFDPSLKAHLGRFTGSIKLDTGRGMADSESYESPVFHIGKYAPRPLEGVIFDFQPIRAALGFNLRGIVGAGALRRNALWLDYDHQSLKILEAVNLKTEGMSQLPITYPRSDLLPFFKTSLLGQETSLLVDTGKNLFIGLAHDIFAEFRANGSIVEDPADLVKLSTAVGTRTVARAHFTRGDLLGVNLAGVAVDETGNSSQVGLGFLCNLNCIFDLKNSVFYYQARKSEPPINAVKMLGALVNYPGGTNTVVQLDPKGGAVSDAGVKEGDHFVRLGPLQASDLNEVSIYELCLNHAGESMKVEVKRPGAQDLIKTTIKIPQRVYEYSPR